MTLFVVVLSPVGFNILSWTSLMRDMMTLDQMVLDPNGSHGFVLSVP